MTIAERVRADLAALDAVEHLGAVVDRNDAMTLARCAELDTNTSESRWHGRTITVKDWIDVEGFSCEGEATHRSGRRPPRDATAVARLRARGAIVIAKTQPQAVHSVHGTCLHPVDPTRNPGGSSTGEAVLAGSGATSLGLGSDSGGSIRLPAAWCGVYGFKPSFGHVPNTGHWPRVGGRHDGRTVIGPIAKNIVDVWPTFEAICGPDGSDPDCVPVGIGTPASVRFKGLRIAVVEPNTTWPLDFATSDATARALDALQRAGAVVTHALPAWVVDDAFDITMRYWRRHAMSGADVDAQLRDWDRYSIRLTRSVPTFDLVLGPTTATVAPMARPMTGDDYAYTLPWSLTGWPAISIPMGTDPVTGLPTAVQVAAPRWHDHVVVAVAEMLALDSPEQTATAHAPAATAIATPIHAGAPTDSPM